MHFGHPHGMFGLVFSRTNKMLFFLFGVRFHDIKFRFATSAVHMFKKLCAGYLLHMVVNHSVV